jgi:hypothetical protein
MVRIAGNAGRYLRIARLHSSCGAPQRHNARRSSRRYIIQPARRQTEMLREAHCRIREEGERRNAKTVNFICGQSGSLTERG